MSNDSYSVAVSAVISADPAACYAAIADFSGSHKEIIPPQYFGPLTIEAGGVGAGTRTCCSLKMLGKSFPFSSEITEPEPGRVLVESVPKTGAVTTFTVVPEAAQRSRVTIETRQRRSAGLQGFMERLITRRMFPHIFTEELKLLAGVVGGAFIGEPVVTRTG
jgi:hypothetical protein